MRKPVTLGWAVFCTFTLLFFNACKKESSTDEVQANIDKKPQKTLGKKKVEDKIKLWLDNQKSVGNEDRNEKIEILKEGLEYSNFHFEELNDAKQFIIVPIKKGLPTIKNIDAPAVLLLTEDMSGDITKGNLVQLIYPNKNGASVSPSTNLFYKLYHNKIEDESRISFFSITGHPIRELEFKKGALSSYKVAQPKTKSLNINRPEPAPISPTPMCIDWYWVSTYLFPDGHTETTETFAFQTCEPTSGGGGEGTEENCDAKLDELEGMPVSHSLSITPGFASPTARTKSYSWTFYEQDWGMWRYDSYEEGSQIKVNNEWIWKSLVHKSIAKSGWSIGGVTDMTILNWIPTVGKYWAGMELWFHFQGSALCKGFPLDINRNQSAKSPVWNVND